MRIHTADLKAEGRDWIARHRRRFDSQVRHLIEEAVSDGSLPACDPKLATFTVLGSLSWLGHWFKDGEALSGEAAARQVVTQLFRGLRPEPAPMAGAALPAAPERGAAEATKAVDEPARARRTAG